jgi:16S rRNA (guanine527-N7)-methyltransferase
MSAAAYRRWAGSGTGGGVRDTGAVQIEAFTAAVEAVAGTFGRRVTADQAARLIAFFELLLVWNRRINLTGAKALEVLVTQHLPDSLALDHLVPPGRSVLDVGSGGGLPAIPFRLLRDDPTLTLLEPRTRRAAFLRTAVRELGLPVPVETHRLERLTSRFDVLSGRAVLPPDQWTAAAVPHLSPGGRVIVYLPESDSWTPPPAFITADSISYTAGGRTRLAVAVTPREPRSS